MIIIPLLTRRALKKGNHVGWEVGPIINYFLAGFWSLRGIRIMVDDNFGTNTGFSVKMGVQKAGVSDVAENAST